MFESLKKKFGSWFGSKQEFGNESKKQTAKEKTASERRKKKKEKIKEKEKAKVEPEGIPEKISTESSKAETKELEEIGEIFEKKEENGFFGKLLGKITTSILNEKDFEIFFDEFEIVLLEHNVALSVVDKICDSLKEELVGKKFKKSEASKKILESLKKSIDNVLLESKDLASTIKKKEGVFVILFFGINGSGKTTSIAKLAHKLQKEGFSCVLAAGDTFRAASIEQLEKHATRLKIPIVKGDYGKDPAAVGFDAIRYARKHRKKVVLIDTAGRMYTKVNLMREMEKIVRVTKPDLKMFVGESITGNDAVSQAETFNDSVGIDGIILTKADVDEKAGTVLSVSFVTGKPIYFLGVGQEYEDLEKFSKKKVFDGLGLD